MKILFSNDQPNERLPPSRNHLGDRQDVWLSLRAKLRENLAGQEYSEWIEPLDSYPTADNSLVIESPNTVFHEGLHAYFEVIERAKLELGYNNTKLSFKVRGAPSTDQLVVDCADAGHYESILDESNEVERRRDGEHRPEVSSEHQNSQESLANEEYLEGDEYNTSGNHSDGDRSSSRRAFSRSLSQEGNLNLNYSFENFIQGESNQMAAAMCQSAGENPGKAYNPLFIYGSTGLGKTHLLHAVGNQVRSANPQSVVTYVTSERFMNEMVYCIRFRKMFEFRRKYRNCDVLLMDDIQFISRRTGMQEEFFHTFNALYADKKQIVITSDLFPRDIPDIQERLRNRFQWGLITDIHPPSVEHRIAILFSKAEQLGIDLGADVAEYIAHRIKRSIRELEGALHRIHAFAGIQGEPISMDLAVRTFRNVLGETARQLTIEKVQKAVADYFKIKISDMKSAKRARAVAYPRQIAMYLCRKTIKASFPEIGQKFGGKDHTTVMHACKKIEASAQKDLDLRAHMSALEREIEKIQ